MINTNELVKIDKDNLMESYDGISFLEYEIRDDNWVLKQNWIQCFEGFLSIHKSKNFSNVEEFVDFLKTGFSYMSDLNSWMRWGCDCWCGWDTFDYESCDEFFTKGEKDFIYFITFLRDNEKKYGIEMIDIILKHQKEVKDEIDEYDFW